MESWPMGNPRRVAAGRPDKRPLITFRHSRSKPGGRKVGRRQRFHILCMHVHPRGPPHQGLTSVSCSVDCRGTSPPSFSPSPSSPCVRPPVNFFMKQRQRRQLAAAKRHPQLLLPPTTATSPSPPPPPPPQSIGVARAVRIMVRNPTTFLC